MLPNSAPPHEVELPQDLVSIFGVMAESRPDRPALAADDASLSYRKLDRWSNAVAQHLRDRGAKRGDRVALRMAPGAPAIASILGILKSGASYVPLDMRNPVDRTSFILADSAADLLVGEPSEGAAAIGTVNTEEIIELRGRTDAARPEGGPSPEDEAYVIYTSGTTGKPKGVPVRHTNVAALLAGAATVFEFSESDRWLLFHSLSFDFSVWEIWGAFACGGELVVLPHWSARNPDQYLKVIADRRITVLNQTPTAFAALSESALRTRQALPDLRYVIFGGEKLLPAALRAWSKEYGLDRPRLVNGYGITETTVFTTFHEVGEDYLTGEESVIGTALPGFEVRVVGDDGKDVPDGEPGELWLAGPQTVDGYLNRPELNAEKFPAVLDEKTGKQVTYYRSGDLVSRNKNGELVYDGRADLQVKLRGYRIELSDIEAAVRRHEAVLDAVVTVREFKPGDVRLMCAFAARDGQRPTTRELREHLKGILPVYMHPARYLQLPELPRTINGKVDRAAVTRSWEREISPS